MTVPTAVATTIVSNSLSPRTTMFDQTTNAGAVGMHGRGVLIGVPRAADTANVVKHARQKRTDASFFFVVVREASTKRAEPVWATYGEKISFETLGAGEAGFNAPRRPSSRIEAESEKCLFGARQGYGRPHPGWRGSPIALLPPGLPDLAG